MVQTPSASETFFGLEISGLDISSITKFLARLRRKISKRLFLIEFGEDSITYAEARVVNDQVIFSKFNRLSMEENALERGVPVDPKMMSSFLTQIIEEEKINAHRVAITLPSQSALSKIIFLPDNLDHEQAINYLSSPSSQFQFPIPLNQTDFDLIPIKSIRHSQSQRTKAYFLNSVPSKLIDNLVETCSEAELEIQSIESAFSSLERLAIDRLSILDSTQTLLILELNTECTHFYIFSKIAPLEVLTLAAIRDFSPPENIEDNESLEDKTINNEDYLTITELDLRVLISEIKRELKKFQSKFKKLNLTEILLSGLNSSHPGIEKIFQEMLDIKTNILRPLSPNNVGDINFTAPIILQSLNRIVGLGLSLVESKELDKFEDNILGDEEISIVEDSDNPSLWPAINLKESENATSMEDLEKVDSSTFTFNEDPENSNKEINLVDENQSSIGIEKEPLLVEDSDNPSLWPVIDTTEKNNATSMEDLEKVDSSTFTFNEDPENSNKEINNVENLAIDKNKSEIINNKEIGSNSKDKKAMEKDQPESAFEMPDF